MLEIGQSLWHPCNMDIIEHRITGIRQYEDCVQYETKAVRNIGASGKLSLLLSHKDSRITFIGYVHGEESVEYESGLQDFVEGKYYTNYDEARLEFHEQQRILAWSNMNNKKRLYDEAKARHDQVDLLVKELKTSIKKGKSQ
jgi:predicted nucleotidyltransferase